MLSLFIESVIIAALIGVLGFSLFGVYMNFLNRKKRLKRDGIPKYEKGGNDENFY